MTRGPVRIEVRQAGGDVDICVSGADGGIVAARRVPDGPGLLDRVSAFLRGLDVDPGEFRAEGRVIVADGTIPVVAPPRAARVWSTAGMPERTCLDGPAEGEVRDVFPGTAIVVIGLNSAGRPAVGPEEVVEAAVYRVDGDGLRYVGKVDP